MCITMPVCLIVQYCLFCLGAMVPPVLIDINKDGTVDIAMAMFNTTFIAFDGESYKELWHHTFPQSESYS